MTTPPSRLMRAEDLAERWQIPVAHTYRLAREGRVPCVRLGRYVRSRLDAIDEFERQQSDTSQEVG